MAGAGQQSRNGTEGVEGGSGWLRQLIICHCCHQASHAAPPNTSCTVTAAHADAKSAMVASWVSQASFEPLGLTIAVAKDRAIESLMQVGAGGVGVGREHSAACLQGTLRTNRHQPNRIPAMLPPGG